jgi:cytidine deaminase
LIAKATQGIRHERISQSMEAALAEARAAAAQGVAGVVIVAAADGRIVAAAGNRTRELSDPTAWAEILATAPPAPPFVGIPLAGMIFTSRPLPDARRLSLFAVGWRGFTYAADPKSAGRAHGLAHPAMPHHAPEVYDGIAAEAAAALLCVGFGDRR